MSLQSKVGDNRSDFYNIAVLVQSACCCTRFARCHRSIDFKGWMGVVVAVNIMNTITLFKDGIINVYRYCWGLSFTCGGPSLLGANLNSNGYN